MAEHVVATSHHLEGARHPGGLLPVNDAAHLMGSVSIKKQVSVVIVAVNGLARPGQVGGVRAGGIGQSGPLRSQTLQRPGIGHLLVAHTNSG